MHDHYHTRATFKNSIFVIMDPWTEKKGFNIEEPAEELNELQNLCKRQECQDRSPTARLEREVNRQQHQKLFMRDRPGSSMMTSARQQQQRVGDPEETQSCQGTLNRQQECRQ